MRDVCTKFKLSFSDISTDQTDWTFSSFNLLSCEPVAVTGRRYFSLKFKDHTTGLFVCHLWTILCVTFVRSYDLDTSIVVDDGRNMCTKFTAFCEFPLLTICPS